MFMFLAVSGGQMSGNPHRIPITQLKQNSPSKFNDIGTEERKERKIAVDQFKNRNATQN